jgi:hypothetical protein
LVAKGSISAEITRRVEEYSRLAGIDKVWILERYKQHIDAELPDLFDDEGMLLPPKQWPKHMKRLVQSVKVVEMEGGAQIGGEGGPKHVPMYTKEVKLEPKLPALAKLLDFVTGAPPTR